MREHREMNRLAEVCVGRWWQGQRVKPQSSALLSHCGTCCSWTLLSGWQSQEAHLSCWRRSSCCHFGQGFSLDGCAGTLKPGWEECRVTWFAAESNLYCYSCCCPFLMYTGQLMKELQGLFEAPNILWVINVSNQLSSVGALFNRCYKKKKS